MNLCSEKWKEDKFSYKNIANILIETLEQCGLNIRNLGTTFTADGLRADGNVVMSAIDQIYVSDDLEEKVTTFKLTNSSSDHVPIVAKINLDFKTQIWFTIVLQSQNFEWRPNKYQHG